MILANLARRIEVRTKSDFNQQHRLTSSVIWSAFRIVFFLFVCCLFVNLFEYVYVFASQLVFAIWHWLSNVDCVCVCVFWLFYYSHSSTTTVTEVTVDVVGVEQTNRKTAGAMVLHWKKKRKCCKKFAFHIFLIIFKCDLPSQRAKPSKQSRECVCSIRTEWERGKKTPFAPNQNRIRVECRDSRVESEKEADSRTGSAVVKHKSNNSTKNFYINFESSTIHTALHRRTKNWLLVER